jgi:hypothetical protein
MAIGNPRIVRGGFEVWLKITGPGGELHEYSCPTQYAPPSKRDYAVLVAGKSLEGLGSNRIDRCYGISKPGKYEIVAVYRDRHREPPPGPPGVSHLGDELVSDPIHVEFVGKVPEAPKRP